MKFSVFALLWLIPFSPFYHKCELNIPAFTCTLTADQVKYKIGEIPSIRIAIANNSGKDVNLIGSLDGSDLKWRMPYCYFTIEKPKPDPVLFPRCGMVNPLRKEDFVLVKTGETFNPYKQIDDAGFFPDHTIGSRETFRNPGLYRIRFHYSTNSPDINKFISIPNNDRLANTDSLLLSPLFHSVPKVDIVSNTIEIIFEN